MIIINKGSKPLSDIELQAEIQRKINNQWPQWKRERSLRKNDGEFNTFMEDQQNTLNTAQENNLFNQQLKSYREAQERLAVPTELNLENDAEGRAAAQAIVDATPEAVKTFEE